MDEPGVDLTRPLHETEERPIGVAIPLLLSRRLDELVKLATQAGVRTYRKDIVAALILNASEDPEELLRLFLDYRKATAGDAAVGKSADRTVLKLERAKPGRRPRGT